MTDWNVNYIGMMYGLFVKIRRKNSTGPQMQYIVIEDFVTNGHARGECVHNLIYRYKAEQNCPLRLKMDAADR